MKILKAIPVLLLLVLVCINSTYAQDKVSTNITLPQATINNFLNEQYNKAGFKRNIKGNVSGVSYDITLQLPELALSTDKATILFGFNIKSNVFNGEVSFSDDIAIKIKSINDLTVQGLSQAFATKVNSLNIPPVLKQVIIGAWQSLQLEVYPMQLAKKIEDIPWIRERAISIVAPFFSVSFRLYSKSMVIELGTYLEAEPPFSAAGIARTNNQWRLNIYSNIDMAVKEVKIYDLNGRYVAGGTNIGNCRKNENVSFPIGNASFAYAFYVTKIIFETADTFYVRGYKMRPNSGNSQPNDILN